MYLKPMANHTHTIYLDDGKYDYIMTITLSGCTVSMINEGMGTNSYPLQNYEFANEAEALEFYKTTIRRENPSYQFPPDLFNEVEAVEAVEEEKEFLLRTFDFDLQEENLETDELVKRLAVVLPSLTIYECESGDYPFEIFFCKVAEQGEFTIDKLLLAQGFMQSVTWDDFLQSVITNSSNLTSYLTLEPNLSPEEIVDKCQKLEAILQTHCKNITVYKLIQFDPILPDRDMEKFHIIVGETHDGNWLGITPKIGSEDYIRTDTYRVQIPTDATPLDSNQISIINTLENVLTGLEFATAEDTTTREFYLTYANSQAQIIYQLLDAIDFVITCSFAPFGSVAEYEDPEYFHNIYPLDQLLQLNLKDLQEYVIGTYCLNHIYAIGKTKNGDSVGVSTVTVAT
jgi:hypothetical protein